MGLDGGTYITRADVLRGQSWAMADSDSSRSTRGGTISASAVYQPKSLDKKADRQSRWSACTLTGRPLAGEVVADYLGSLYLYEAVLEFLLARAGLSVNDESQDRLANQLRQCGDLGHLKSKKDVFQIHLPAAASVHAPGVRSCPVSDLRSDTVPFSALSACGHVFSNRALAQMTDGSCALCGTSWTEAQVVPLNPTQETLQALRESLERRLKAARPQRSSKRKRAQEIGAPQGQESS